MAWSIAAILIGLTIAKKITELLACNLSFSSNHLLVVHTLRNILILPSCLGRPNASTRGKERKKKKEKKKSLGGKDIKAADNVVLTSVKQLCCPGNVLPWKAMAVSTSQGCPGEINAVCLEWRRHPTSHKANVYNTLVITLLYAWKDSTIYSCHGKWSSQFFTQCLPVLAGTEGHDEISTTEISDCCQILLCSSENLGACQLIASSKPSPTAYSDRVKSWKTEEMLLTPA